jgi:hypothetical protein
MVRLVIMPVERVKRGAGSAALDGRPRGGSLLRQPRPERPAMSSNLLMDVFVYGMSIAVFATLFWLGLSKRRQEREEASRQRESLPKK